MSPKPISEERQRELDELFARARAALATLKEATAQAGGHAVLLLDQGAEFLLAQVGDDPSLSFRHYIHVGGALAKFDRYFFNLDVPPAPETAAIPDCRS